MKHGPQRCYAEQVDRIFTAQGPQQAEKLLLEKVVAEARTAAEDPGLLQQPVLIVVPSSELRLVLIGKLAQAGATLGVEVQTLHSVALNLHRSAGLEIRSGGLLSEVLARRAVSRQSGLQETFEPLADGFGLVAASVRDLLTAGWGGADRRSGNHLDRGEIEVDDLAGLNSQTKEVLRAAAETKAQMQQRGCRRPGDLQLRAADLVEQHLNARSVWIYGFADVTGQSQALVRALWQHHGKLIVDLPPDPAFAGEDRGARFARRFVQRVCAAELPATGEGIDTETENPNFARSASKREFFHTSGRSDEVREVAHRIRKLLASGTPAENVGVVVRQYGAYASHIRNWFPTLGVPFRAPAPPAGFFPDHRRLRAALEVLQLGAGTTLDRWLDALSRAEKGGVLKSRVEDFRIAMRTLGAARLDQAAALNPAELAGEHGVYRLPLRVRAEESQNREDGERRRSQSRVLTLTELLSDISLIQQTLQRLAEWPKRASLADHAEYARLTLEQNFGWNATRSDWHELLDKVAELDVGNSNNAGNSNDAGPANKYDAKEFMVLLTKASREYGVPRSTAAGGGVAVLDYTQARGRSFDALFLLGLNKGVVPRAISDDAVLPDSQRAVLQSQLPDLPLRSSGHEEERYLFAQLCAAAPKLTLSWLRADDDGKEIAPSSYLQRIWLGQPSGQSEDNADVIPRLRNELFANSEQPLTEAEAQQFFALQNDRGSWIQLFPNSTPRLHVLNEIEPGNQNQTQRQLHSRLGPYLGTAGPQPTPEQLFVTTLEGLAICPWRSLLERQLRVEPIDDPLHDLPGADALMLGNVVHDALEELVRDGAGGQLKDGRPIQVSKPTASAIAEAVTASARKVALAEEMRLQGMIDALAVQARPFVQRAVDLEWPDDHAELEVIGCEWQGKTTVSWEGGEFDLHFRADRVDQGEDGLVFTDYKTSKPLADVVKPNSKRLHHLKQLAAGKRLQGTAYASSSFDASGRYLFLKVDEERMDRNAEFRVNHDDEEFLTEFSRTCGVLHQSMAAGILMPRMDRPYKDDETKNNEACEYCKVADACLLRDSGNRGRLAAAVKGIAERRMMNDSSVSEAEQIISDLWYLGVTAPWSEEVDE